DGVEDIGKQFETFFGPAIGEGSYEDFWYSGNEAELFKNRFGPETKPSTKTNSGANSLINFENFSAVSNKMSFKLSYGSGNIKPVSVTDLNLTAGKKFLTPILTDGAPLISVTDNMRSIRYDVNGVLKSVLPNFSSSIPASSGFNQIGTDGKILKLRGMTALDYQFLSDISAPVVMDQSGVNGKIYIGTADGHIYVSNPIGELLNFVPFSFQEVISRLNETVKQISANPDYVSAITQNYFADSKGNLIHLSSPTIKLISFLDSSSKPFSVVLTENNEFHIISEGKTEKKFAVSPESVITDFSMADLFGDGNNYLLISNGKNLEAYNINGDPAKNFPFTIGREENFTGAPLVLDLKNDGTAVVIGYTNSGTIYAFNPSTGKPEDGFPLSTGVQFSLNPVLLKEELPAMGPMPVYKPYLAAVDITNRLYVWNLSPVQGKSFWSGVFGDEGNSSFAGAPSKSNQPQEFFPSDKAYNWPNPVYGGETRIRYYVSENSNVNIKIFDLAGELVIEFNDRATGGMDNETSWDVSRIESGIYYARLDLKSESGASANKTIKIAVIK
ncbi:MAG: T9SS type A sorting domain-containing protein, partial [Melioribacteraceae bacterium]